MANYWDVGYNGAGAFPRTQMLVMGSGGFWSKDKVVAIVGGTPVSGYSDVVALTDGLGQDVVKLAGPSGLFVVDMEAAVTPNVIGLLNHNVGVSIDIVLSNASNLASPTLTTSFIPESPVAFIDLRGFSFAASRYIGYRINGNAVPITIGELFAGEAEIFDGPIEGESLEVTYVAARDFNGTEHGIDYVTTSGFGTRAIRASFDFRDELDRFRDLLDAAADADQSLLFIPCSRHQEGFWVEWPEEHEASFTSVIINKFSIDLIEEVFSIIGTGTPLAAEVDEEDEVPVETFDCLGSDYLQDWSDGDADIAFDDEVYQRAPGGSDPTDAVYPEIHGAEAMKFVAGGGPAGENVVDGDTFDGGTYGVAGIWFDHDIAVTGAYRVATMYRPTTAAWDYHDIGGTYAPLLHLLKSNNDSSIKLNLNLFTPASPVIDVRWHSWDDFNVLTEDIPAPGLSRANTENKWILFEIEFKPGEVTGTGTTPTDVAPDGYIRIYYTNITASGARTLLYEATNADLVLNMHLHSWLSGFANRNYIKGSLVGYNGLYGQQTNLRFCPLG